MGDSVCEAILVVALLPLIEPFKTATREARDPRGEKTSFCMIRDDVIPKLLPEFLEQCAIECRHFFENPEPKPLDFAVNVVTTVYTDFFQLVPDFAQRMNFGPGVA